MTDPQKTDPTSTQPIRIHRPNSSASSLQVPSSSSSTSTTSSGARSRKDSTASTRSSDGRTTPTSVAPSTSPSGSSPSTSHRRIGSVFRKTNSSPSVLKDDASSSVTESILPSIEDLPSTPSQQGKERPRSGLLSSIGGSLRKSKGSRNSGVDFPVVLDDDPKLVMKMDIQPTGVRVGDDPGRSGSVTTLDSSEDSNKVHQEEEEHGAIMATGSTTAGGTTSSPTITKIPSWGTQREQVQQRERDALAAAAAEKEKEVRSGSSPNVRSERSSSVTSGSSSGLGDMAEGRKEEDSGDGEGGLGTVKGYDVGSDVAVIDADALTTDREIENVGVEGDGIAEGQERDVFQRTPAARRTLGRSDSLKTDSWASSDGGGSGTGSPAGSFGRRSGLGTPQRRSIYDLQAQLAEIFDSLPSTTSTPSASPDPSSSAAPPTPSKMIRTCACADLPRLITDFENRRGVEILEPQEVELVRDFAINNPDVEISSDMLLDVLAALTNRSRNGGNEEGRPGVEELRRESPLAGRVRSIVREGSNASLGGHSSGSAGGASEDEKARWRVSTASSDGSDNGLDLGGLKRTRSAGVLTASGMLDLGSPTPTAEAFPEHASQVPEGGIGFPRSRSHNQELDKEASGAGNETPSIASARLRAQTAEGPGGDRGIGSAGGGTLGSTGFLKHARPAPPKGRRQSTEIRTLGSGARPVRSRHGSEEPSSPPFSPGLDTPTPAAGSNVARGPGARKRQSSFPLISPTTSEPPSSPGFSRTQSGPFPQSFSASHLPLSPGDDAEKEGLSPGLDKTSFYPRPLSPTGSSSPPLSPPSELDSFPSLGQSMAPLFDQDQDSADTSMTSSGNSPSPTRRRFISTTSSSRPASGFIGEGFGANESLGFRPDSVVSLSSMMGGTGDQFQTLLRQHHELSKKFKEVQKNLETVSNSNEDQIADLESRLEEARAELTQRRKDEKELRSKERQNLGQLSDLEAEVAKLQRALDKQKESYQSLKRRYEEQCDEAEKLRNTIRTKDSDLRAAEESAQLHAGEVAKFNRDREFLQSAMQKLEAELGIAKQAQEAFDDQQQENMALKETIDRLRFDLDELRNQAGPGSASTTSGSRSGGSMPSSMSRTLGNEIARRLREGDGFDDEEDLSGDETEGEAESRRRANDSGDSYVEEVVVTTHRRRKRRPGLEAITDDLTTSPVGDEPDVPPAIHFAPIREVLEQEIQTDLSITTPSNTFGSQTEPTPEPEPTPVDETGIQTLPTQLDDKEVETVEVKVEEDDAATQTVPAPAVVVAEASVQAEEEEKKVQKPVLDLIVMTDKEKKEKFAKELGVDLQAIEAYFADRLPSGEDGLKRRRVKGESDPTVVVPPTGSSRLRGPSRWSPRPFRFPNIPYAHLPVAASSTIINIFPPAAQPYLSSILQSGTTFALYSIMLYLAGVITGAAMLPTRHHHHLAPYSVLLGDDRAMWAQYNTMREGFAPSGGGWRKESVLEGIWTWIERLIYDSANLARGTPT